MKRIQNIYIIAALMMLIGTSCEKVIDLNLNNTTPQLVVEGNISDQPGPYTVKLSNSVNYDQSNDFPPVQGAVITISDDKGHSETLTETTPGTYQTSTLQGAVGNTYTLHIKTTDSKEYTSTTTMPALVPLDSVYAEKASFSFSKEDTIDAVAVFTDPKTIRNNYRLLLTINDKPSGAINVFYDKFFDGNQVNFTIFRKDKEYIKKGDSLTVEMRNLDEPNYTYFNELNDVINNGGGSAAPANPTSNIVGGALGYFCAYSSTKMVVIVK